MRTLTEEALGRVFDRLVKFLTTSGTLTSKGGLASREGSGKGVSLIQKGRKGLWRFGWVIRRGKQERFKLD